MMVHVVSPRFVF